MSFRPPFEPPFIRKRTAENEENSLTDDIELVCCSEGHASTQNSQEVLSCGFLPAKQRKRTSFQPPLRDLVSPGQGYINRILHEEESRPKEGTTPSCLASNFELAPLSHSNQIISNDSTTVKNVKKHHYYYHVGNRKIEQPVKAIDHKKATIATASAISMDENDKSRFRIFEFQLSQATEKDDKPKCEGSKPLKPLVQVIWITMCVCVMCLLKLQHHISMDICLAIKKARQEIREIRRRYAAKKAGCFTQGINRLV